jgi:hypothetical protein
VIEMLPDSDVVGVGTFGDHACAPLLAEEEAVIVTAIGLRRLGARRRS